MRGEMACERGVVWCLVILDGLYFELDNEQKQRLDMLDVPF